MSDMHNFSAHKQRAIEQIFEMNKKAAQPEAQPQQNTMRNMYNSVKKSPNNFGVNFSNDDMLIMGLILILSEDCRDMWLFLALIYILM